MSHATRKQAGAPSKLERLRRVLPLAGALLLLIGATFAVNWMQVEFAKQNEWQMQRVRIVGELRQVTVSEILEVLAVQNGQTLADVDMPALTDKVSMLPWIRSVELRRQFPGELVVSIVEREPWLRLNDNALVDAEGEAFMPRNVAAFAHLPQLQTDIGNLHLAQQEYGHANKALQPVGLSVAVLTLNARGALSLQLNNGVALMFGRNDWQPRLERFVSLFPGLSSEGQLPLYVDLRYDTGFAVAWPDKDTEKTPKTAGL